MNLLQNHNVKLESENFLLRREIKNLHRQLYQQYNPNDAPLNQPFRSNPSISTESNNSNTQQPTHQSTKPIYDSSNDGVNHSVDQLNHTNENVTTYQTPSGVIKEVNYDHRNDFDLTSIIKSRLTR